MTDEHQRNKTLLELVHREVAAELDHPSPDVIHPKRPFRDLGVDSLTSVRLRNRIAKQTGLPLPASLVFDYPTPQLVAGYLSDRLGGGEARDSSVLQEIDRLEELLTAVAPSSTARARITARLSDCLSRWNGSQNVVPGVSSEANEEFEAATNDEIFELIENEFDIS